MVRHLLFSTTIIVASSAVVSCKSAPRGEGSDVLTVAVSGTGYFRAAYVQSGTMKFLKDDPAKGDVVLDARGNEVIDFTLSYSGSNGQTIKISRPGGGRAKFPNLEPDPGSNYGWRSEWSCKDAKELVSVTPETGDDRKRCLVQMSTEDENYFSIGAIILPPAAQPADQAIQAKIAQTRKEVPIPASAAVPTGAITNNPIPPGRTNAGISAADKQLILRVMGDLHARYQTSPERLQARNSCLQNARARNWLDLQSHFYCLLQYNPHRKCYSTPLAEAKPRLDAIPDPQQRLGALIQLQWETYKECRKISPGLKDLTDDEARVFKYLMFTFQGAMDLNVEDEQEVINKFYDAIGERPRPRRLTDTFPWIADQGRYNLIRAKQLGLPAPGGGSPPPPGPTPITQLTPELKTAILNTMRLNRQAFQEQRVLDRYNEKRPPAALPGKNPTDGSAIPNVFQACGLPRKPAAGGLSEPLAAYPAVIAEAPNYASFSPREYKEAEIVKCLTTTSGLAGSRPEPLQQHFYCTLPGFSPDIRGCFTFQIRVSVDTRSAVDDQAFITLRNQPTQVELTKFWEFNGTDQEKVDARAAGKIPPHLVEKAYKYCVDDGRPAKITRNNRNVQVNEIHPNPTRPMCYVALTQQQLFQMIMGGVIDIPVREQIALLKEFYNCTALGRNIGRGRDQISQGAYDAYCTFDTSQWPP